MLLSTSSCLIGGHTNPSLAFRRMAVVTVMAESLNRIQEQFRERLYQVY